MLKKIVVGVLLVGLIVVLVIGAINRTLAKDRPSEEVIGQGEGVGHPDVGEDQDGSPAAQQSRAGSEGNGQGQPGGSGGGTNQEVAHEWLELRGEVESVDGIGLSVTLSDGEVEILDAREWQFAQEQGFSAQVGDQVILYGFYQGGDFKPGQVDDLTSGQSVLLRNREGKPLWSGGGKVGN